ncbi:MAG: hypothetical protein AAF515_18165 [Pseudomonadota bacterium]
MKRFLVVVLGVLVASYFWLAFIGVEPQDRRPGTKLSGSETPIPADWSVLDDVAEVHLETRPWFGIPFSVTVVAAAVGDSVFVPSIYDSPMQFPGSKYWNTVVAANPNVRLRVHDKLYSMQIVAPASPAEVTANLEVLASKYDFWRDKLSIAPDERSFTVLQLQPAS